MRVCVCICVCHEIERQRDRDRESNQYVQVCETCARVCHEREREQSLTHIVQQPVCLESLSLSAQRRRRSRCASDRRVITGRGAVCDGRNRFGHLCVVVFVILQQYICYVIYVIILYDVLFVLLLSYYAFFRIFFRISLLWFSLLQILFLWLLCATYALLLISALLHPTCGGHDS